MATKNGAGWKFDFSGIKKLKDLKKINKRMTSGEMDTIIEVMSEHTAAWPFEGLDPSKPEDYDELDIKTQWQLAQTEFTEAFKNYFRMEEE